MPKIVFIQPDGTRHVVEAAVGRSVMQVAVDHLPAGAINGDCGGCCSCATCHAYVAPEWDATLPPRQEDEEMMLEGVPEPRATSRLTCQIEITDALDGICFEVPASQY